MSVNKTNACIRFGWENSQLSFVKCNKTFWRCIIRVSYCSEVIHVYSMEDISTVGRHRSRWTNSYVWAVSIPWYRVHGTVLMWSKLYWLNVYIPGFIFISLRCSNRTRMFIKCAEKQRNVLVFYYAKWRSINNFSIFFTNTLKYQTIANAKHIRYENSIFGRNSYRKLCDHRKTSSWELFENA